jgi:mannose-6-phosphate isomerase-like protein (cupin superfamily)
MEKRAAIFLVGAGILSGYALASVSQGAAMAANPPIKATCPWGPEYDSVRAAPKNHKVLLENDRVRVLDVTVQPGEREPLHAHCRPSVLYITQRGALRDRDKDGHVVLDEASAPPLPAVQWHETEPLHSVENLDAKPLHIVRIELKDPVGNQ